jgi:hypothetical protein
MQKTNERNSVCQLFGGIFISELGMFLLALGAWDALKAETRTLIYVAGVLLFITGLWAIQINAIRLPAVQPEPALRLARTPLDNFGPGDYFN